MSYLKCYEILGLRPGASRREIHRAYKRLALRHHPDRSVGDPYSVVMFCRVTEAYTTLKKGLGRHRRGAPPAECPKCGKADELFTSLNGARYCAACLLGTRRRILPLPQFKTVRCVAAVIFQVAGAGFAVATIATGEWWHALAGSMLVLAAMTALTYNVCTADVIEA